MARTSLRTKLAAVAATGVMALGTGVLAASPAQAATTCPTYFACIHWGTSQYDVVRNAWQNKGVYKIYFYNGSYRVTNSQTDGWKIWLCRAANGTDCDYALWPGQSLVIDMTPFNSVSIQP
ncbi:hypothetical protein OG730_20295 [Streptomyces sp. NBC_01298]|uniref:hypothetical protein n=1 Tax=Streptomyces sp. NBC_01298 TaxID=2903817 RepID=UPI002E13C100|nr:hypothetical protein OG730_20295 [Streptomyces sp. NBC_01298]